MYLVVDSKVMSAPRSSGRCSTGVRNVLSTATLIPALCATLTIAAMSVSLSVGFAGVSMKTSCVLGRIACATASGSDVSTKRSLDAEVGQDLLKQPHRAAVDDVGNDDVVARPQNGQEQ